VRLILPKLKHPPVVEMSVVGFHLPDKVKEIAPSTAKVYKSYLNRFAKGPGWDTVEQLIARQKQAAQFIEEQSKTLQEQRVWLSAVMYVLPEEYRSEGGVKTAYYHLFQKSNEFSKAAWPAEKARLEAGKAKV
jgi:hypothetical protein